MSFFSIAQLENTHDARKIVRDLTRAGAAYRDHALTWMLFPSQGESRASSTQDERTSDFVFRRRDEQVGEEDAVSRASLSYYLVSQRMPEPVAGVLAVRSKPFAPALQAGEAVRFQLRANPSVAHRRPGKRSAHHDVLMHTKLLAGQAGKTKEEQGAAVQTAATAWLVDHAAKWGLRADPEQLFVDAYTQHELRPGRNRTICYSSLDYAGTACVSDPVLLHEAMLHGVGRKRAFGCGLLLLKRLE